MAFATPTSAPPPPDPVIGGQRVNWGAVDVVIGIAGYFVAFVLAPAFVVAPVAIATGTDSRPTFIVIFVATMFSQLALVAVAAWRSFGVHGGGWEKLGFRRVRMSLSIKEGTCARCGTPPEPKAAFCIRCGSPLDASVHAVALGRVLVWALAALVGAYVFAFGYAVIVESFDIGWLKSQCDDQIPAEVLNDNLLLAIAGVGIVGFAPFCEEIFFRGFMFPGFLRRLGVVAAIVLSSVLFSGAHLQYKAFVPILGVALAFAFAYYRSGTIYSTMLAHLAFNTVAFTALAATTCDPDAGTLLPLFP